MINALIKPKLFWHSKFMRNRALSNRQRDLLSFCLFTQVRSIRFSV